MLAVNFLTMVLAIFYVVTSNSQCLNTMMKCIAVRFWFGHPNYVWVNMRLHFHTILIVDAYVLTL